MLLVRMVSYTRDTIRLFVVLARDEHFRWSLILIVSYIEYIDYTNPIARQDLSTNEMQKC